MLMVRSPDFAHAAVVSSTYLESLKDKVSGTRGLNERSLKKQELHELSKARAAQWDNTIEGLRDAKERRLQAKRDAEEAKRVEQDKYEAEVAAAKRKEVLDRAQRLLYERDDRVKTLHSAMLQSEVLKVLHCVRS